MTTPRQSLPRASLRQIRLSRAARSRFARSGRDRKIPGDGRPSPEHSRSPVCGTAGGTPSTGLDHLALDSETPTLAEPAQTPHDLFVPDLLGRAAVVADHELAVMGMLDVTAGDERARSFDLMDRPAGSARARASGPASIAHRAWRRSVAPARGQIRFAAASLRPPNNKPHVITLRHTHCKPARARRGSRC